MHVFHFGKEIFHDRNPLHLKYIVTCARSSEKGVRVFKTYLVPLFQLTSIVQHSRQQIMHRNHLAMS